MVITVHPAILFASKTRRYPSLDAADVNTFPGEFQKQINNVLNFPSVSSMMIHRSRS